MGGFGSGRTGWKPKAESSKRVDVRYLYKRGMLTPGKWSSLYWDLGGEPRGDIRLKAEDYKLTLVYRIRPHGDDEWHNVEEDVWLDWTSCQFGGRRPWFRCPQCSRRIAVLYGLGMYFLCRHCHDVTYWSRCEGTMDRLIRKQRKLKKRLSYDGTEDGDVLFKPKGMHQKTFDRLLAEYWELDEEFAKEMMQRFGIRF